METFYTALLDLDYLREDEVQFPRHTDEEIVPLAAAIQSAGINSEAEQLLRRLPYVTRAAYERFEGESLITPASKTATYLDCGEGYFTNDERQF